MTAFMWYQNKVSDNVIDLSIPKNGVCFDGAITVSSGFEMAGSKKRIYWKNDLPYGKLVEDGTLFNFIVFTFKEDQSTPYSNICWMTKITISPDFSIH